MIPLSHCKGRKVAVMGLGRSGLAAAQALAAGGANVLAWDDDAGARNRAAAAGIAVADLAAADLRGFAALVLSPGIPLHFPAPHPAVAAARGARVPVIGDIELLAREIGPARLVGVTGTNGKSTTTALIGHVLAHSGVAAAVGGNLGPPALGLDPPGAGGVYVLEVSSFQLDLLDEARFDVALLLNITPDHLYRHGGMEGYVAAKRRIFRNQTAGCCAVIGIDDADSARLYQELRAQGPQRVIAISSRARAAGGVYVRDGVLRDDTGGADVPVLDLAEAPRLPGVHNWQNAAAALAAARALGLPHSAIAAAIRSFPGLPHRQELVAIVGGVRFVNDSKATNADAAAKALACYRDIYWIAGGRPKEGGIAPLAPFFPRIAHAFLIGEGEAEFARTLEGRVPFTRCGDLAAAVAAAARMARADGRPAPVVLLSPACASFDQWANFEARGEGFRRLVAELAVGGGGGAGEPACRAGACS